MTLNGQLWNTAFGFQATKHLSFWSYSQKIWPSSSISESPDIFASLSQQKALPFMYPPALLYMITDWSVPACQGNVTGQEALPWTSPIPLWITPPWIYVLLLKRQLIHSSNRFAKPILQELELQLPQTSRQLSIAMFCETLTCFLLPAPTLPPIQTHTVRLRRQDCYFFAWIQDPTIME